MATQDKNDLPAAGRYSPAVALEFFQAAGKPEDVARGTVIFAENEKARPYLFMRDKMYLLLDGEVDLVARKKVIGTVARGGIFGEMASITHAPRPAHRERGGEDRLPRHHARRQTVPRRPAHEAGVRADADEHDDRAPARDHRQARGTDHAARRRGDEGSRGVRPEAPRRTGRGPVER
ncbi:MAG: cyclic nucleotide-binding domain-containing protein [Betaproteobacteria bacterium]|nr:cyclic nucleotide-binding domain-containing protein [Betaproteobacteria bacterium]